MRHFQILRHTIRKRIRLFLSLLLYSFIAATQLLATEPDDTYPTKDRLFYIARSANKNLVCYDVNLKDGKLDTENPLNVYWVNREEKPGKTNGLSFIQKKMAYGYKVVSQGNNTSEVTLTAYPDKKLTIRKQDSKYICQITIDNQPAILQSLYVKAKESNPLSVEYVELYGINPQTQQKVTERVRK